jgi:arginyl-tRNA synthetase
MLSFEGNTAPYMQYAYARIRSIFRRAGEEAGDEERIGPGEPAERALLVRLLQFPETLHATADKCMPNLLCAYLYDLAGAYMRFYEKCPVLRADADVRAGRLALCALTARVVAKGLGLLGIKAVERM